MMAFAVLMGVGFGIACPAVLIWGAHIIARADDDPLTRRRDVLERVWPIGIGIALGWPFIVIAVDGLGQTASWLSIGFVAGGVAISIGLRLAYRHQLWRTWWRDYDWALLHNSSLLRPLMTRFGAGVAAFAVSVVTALAVLMVSLEVLKAVPFGSGGYTHTTVTFVLMIVYAMLFASIAVAPIVAAIGQHVRIRHDRARYRREIEIGRLREQRSHGAALA